MKNENELFKIYTLQKDQAGNSVLMYNGSEMCCPFQPPLMIANNFGGNSIVRLPCSTQCALAEIETLPDQPEYFCTYCTGSKLLYEIEKQTTLELV